MAKFPLYIEMDGRKVIIVGGGAVALRKAGILSGFGARILVISPVLCDGWQDLDRAKITFCQKRLDQRDFSCLDSAFMVILATEDRAFNQAAAAYCRMRGIWADCATPVGSARSETDFSFIFPSIVKRKNIVIGISSSGGVPALTRHLREKISGFVPEWYGDLEEKLRVEREKLKSCSLSSEEKRQRLRRMIVQAEIRAGKAAEGEEEKVERIIDTYDCENWNQEK